MKELSEIVNCCHDNNTQTLHTPHTVESHTTQTQYKDITTLEDQGHTKAGDL